jgi:hypothetical protein
VYSGVPKAGAPVFMSTFEVKPPYMQGAPGAAVWISVMPARASAFCCANAPAMVAGAMAPESVKGVSTIGWPWRDISSRPWIIGPSRRRGEFELTIENRLGSRASCSCEINPRAMRIISMASLMRCLPRE